MFPDGYEARLLAVEDAPAIAAAYRTNRDHLRPWEPIRSSTFYEVASQRVDAENKLRAVADGTQAWWILWHGDDVVGRVGLTNLVRGVFLSANLGYWVDHRHLGRGLATAAVGHVCGEAAGMGLHRLEAGTLVENHASRAVLRRNGFSEIGLAPDYLFIAGAWRDHLLFQRILSREKPAPA